MAHSGRHVFVRQHVISSVLQAPGLGAAMNSRNPVPGPHSHSMVHELFIELFFKRIIRHR